MHRSTVDIDRMIGSLADHIVAAIKRQGWRITEGERDALPFRVEELLKAELGTYAGLRTAIREADDLEEIASDLDDAESKIREAREAIERLQR